MRGGRSFLILVVLALGLGAYIYFVEMKRDPAAADTPAKEKVFAIDPGKIEEVEVRAESGEVTTVRKTGDTWRITAPASLDVDTTEVGGLVSSLESLERQRVIDENPASVKAFGLDPARITVTFKAAGDTAPRTLLVGNRTPTGGDLYARVDGAAPVFLISSFVEDSFNKTTFNLRDKSVLSFDREGVTSVALAAAGEKPVTLARAGEVWRVTAPLDAKADFSAIDGLVGRIYQARMKSLVETTGDAASLKKFGLDSPQATVTLGGGSNRATLEIGGTVDGDDTARYARDLARPLVFTVDAALIDDVKKPAADWRAKDLFRFRSFTATNVDLTLNGQAVAFVKEKPAGADQSSAVETWKIVKPAPKDVDSAKANDLLSTLSNLRAESFADKAVTGDELTVVARSTDAAGPRDEQITFRKSGDVVHAIVAGEPGAAVVNATDFDKVVALLKELAGLK